MTARVDAAVGRYVHVELEGETYRTYFEEAGEGVPLVCLHTAGGDSRQYRHLLEDEEITKHFHVIAFDLPWHGRSLPPDGWWTNEYRLTRSFYVGFIGAFCDALELDRPVVAGCSMGGYVVLDLAHEEPERYRALIGIQTRAYAPTWTSLVPILKHPEVDFHSMTAPVQAFCSVDSPEARAREVAWVYATGGPGVMAGDFFYAAEDHDARPFLSELDTDALPLFVIGGDHDPSCLPEHTEELARRLPGVKVTRIPDAGHFPPAENPPAFKRALMPILDALVDAPVR